MEQSLQGEGCKPRLPQLPGERPRLRKAGCPTPGERPCGLREEKSPFPFKAAVPGNSTNVPPPPFPLPDTVGPQSVINIGRHEWKLVLGPRCGALRDSCAWGAGQGARRREPCCVPAPPAINVSLKRTRTTRAAQATNPTFGD